VGMDDFERAIFFSFDQSGAVDDQLKAQARAFCDQAKQSPTIWQACFDKFRISQYAEVQFWCLQALEEVTRLRYVGLDPQERHFVRSSLMEAMCSCDVVNDNGQSAAGPRDPQQQVSSRPAFVKNKLAQIIVNLICIEYPSEWPSVFLEMLSNLSKGPSVVDMFCRIFNTLDEEVISLDYPRSFEEIASATRIKDAMRQQCISQIVGAWYSLAVTYRVQQPYLASAVLDTLHRYVAWIDIGLVANDSFVPLLFEILVSQLELTQLRGSAADCLLAIVSKRMEATSKLALLQKLHIGQVCSRLTEEQEPEFALKLTALLTGLATEILECSKKFDNANNGVSSQAHAATETASAMLDEVLPSVFCFMRHGNEDISSATFQFLSNYVGRMKSGLDSNGKQAAHVAQILEVIRNRMLHDPANEDCLEGPDKIGQEEEERLSEFRKDLFGLFRIIHRVAPDVTRTFVQSTLRAALANPDVGLENVEAAISLLFVLGEGLTEDALKVQGGVLGDMVRMLLSSSVPSHSHRVVALVYLETVTRYVRFVQLHPEYIPSALAAFLDRRGLHHPNAAVRSRANYLFTRLVKVLRSQLTPYIEDIFQVCPSLTPTYIDCTHFTVVVVSC
jgi:exportin-T